MSGKDRSAECSRSINIRALSCMKNVEGITKGRTGMYEHPAHSPRRIWDIQDAST